MARENQLWEWLKKAGETDPARIHMTRVENSATAGMPDVEGHHATASGQFWFELKSGPRPARPSTVVRFGGPVRNSQVEWNEKRWAVGGRNYFLVQVGSGPDRRIYLVPGNRARDLQKGMTEDDIFRSSELNIHFQTKKTLDALAMIGRVLA